MHTHIHMYTVTALSTSRFGLTLIFNQYLSPSFDSTNHESRRSTKCGKGVKGTKEGYSDKHLRTRSATVRHWREISPSAYERNLVTNEKV